MKKLLAALLLSLVPSVALAQTYSPLPLAIGAGPGELDPYNFTNGFPGDNHGALGRQYLLTKVNEALQLYNRNNGSYSTPVPDSQLTPGSNYYFWPPAPGAKQFVAAGDGRVLYDPYGPASCPTGHFIVAEAGVMHYSNSDQNQAGIYLAVSKGEDPDPSNPGGNFYFYWIPAGLPSSNVCAADGGPPCYADFPQLGFNTNWIGVTGDFFGSNYQPVVIAIQRQPAECSNTVTAIETLWTLTNFVHVMPAETYYHNGTDQYGSTLYLAWVENQTNAQIGIGEITGAASSPAVTPLVATVAPSPATGWGWQNQVEMAQSGGGLTIDPGPGDDRFTGFVARNNYLWLAQSIGIPWNGTAETNANCTTTPSDCRNFGQFLQIATSNLTLAYPPVRWGPSTTGVSAQPSTQYDVIDPSIAVNASSDFVMGFQTVSPSDYLQAQYVYHDHTSGAGSLTIPFTFKHGSGEYVDYEPTVMVAIPSRTGDYGHANPDPLDDNSFFVAAGYAGSNWSGTSYYGWSHGWALVNPPPVKFVGSARAEAEDATTCTGVCEQNCTVTLAAPAGAQAGDVFVVTLDASQPQNVAPTIPSGWTILPVANQGGSQYISTVPDAYGDWNREWTILHQHSTSDGGSYSFYVPLQYYVSGGLCFVGEVNAMLSSYRGASGTFSNYKAYGYPSNGDATTITVGPINPPNNVEVIGVFRGSADSDDAVPTPSFTAPTGYPPLSPETALSPTGEGLNAFAADLWTAGFTGFNYGAYQSTTNLSSPTLGWLVLMPKQ